jgi:hypothetical protein
LDPGSEESEAETSEEDVAVEDLQEGVLLTPTSPVFERLQKAFFHFHVIKRREIH